MATLLVLAACASSPNRAPTAAAPTTTAGAPTTTATAATPTTATTSTAPCGWRSAPPAVYDHVLWIVMENHSYQQVIGNAAAPYETALAHQCGTDDNYASVGSPSLPNYIGATSGGTQGIADDDAPSSHPLTVDNLFRQVRASGRTERSYEEAMPASCDLGSSGTYAVKHNPAAYYTGAGDRAACQADDIALGTTTDGALAAALDSGTLPTFSLVTPDLCNDTHDCAVGVGDGWLSRWVPRILASSSYRSGSMAVFVVWDEDTPMPDIVVAPSVRAGTVATARVDHYSLLRTTEELLGLPTLLGRAADAASMRPVFGI